MHVECMVQRLYSRYTRILDGRYLSAGRTDTRNPETGSVRVT